MTMQFSLAVLLACTSIGFAQTPDPCATAPQTCATLVDTHATSETRIPNTVVDIRVQVSSSGKDMAEVQRTLAEKSNSLLAYLKAQKVDRLMTMGVSFSPETRYDKNAPDKTVGYNGSQTVSFRTTPEKAADLLAGVLTNGANQIQSTAFTPTEREIDEARSKLSEEATHIAMEQASAIARAAGMHVASIRHINVEDTGVVRPMPVSFGMMAKAAPGAVPMDTAAGDQSISVRVDVTAAAMK